MHAGRQTKMKRGAIWACVIPVGLGVIGLSLLLLDVAQRASIGAKYWDHILILLPIIACFILGAPLSAWLACRNLKKINSFEKLSLWRSSASRGLLSAGLVHLVWSTLYIIVVVIIILNLDSQAFGNSFDRPGNPFFSMLLGFTMMNLFLWLFITLPLSLLCATIFWKVTKFPDNTDVF